MNFTKRYFIISGFLPLAFISLAVNFYPPSKQNTPAVHKTDTTLVYAVVPQLGQGYSAFKTLFPSKQVLVKVIKQLEAENRAKKPMPAQLKKAFYSEIDSMVKKSYLNLTDSLSKHAVGCDSLECWKVDFKGRKPKDRHDFFEAETRWITGRHKKPDEVMEVVLRLYIVKPDRQYFLAKATCIKVWKPYFEKYRESLMKEKK